MMPLVFVFALGWASAEFGETERTSPLSPSYFRKSLGGGDGLTASYSDGSGGGGGGGGNDDEFGEGPMDTAEGADLSAYASCLLISTPVRWLCRR